MEIQHESYLTVREVAEIFRISDTTIYAWIKAGEVAAVQVGGGSWRIPQSQFEGWAINPAPSHTKEGKANE